MNFYSEWKYYILFILASKCIKNARVRSTATIYLFLCYFEALASEQLSGFWLLLLLPFPSRMTENSSSISILLAPSAIIMYYDDGSFLTFYDNKLNLAEQFSFLLRFPFLRCRFFAFESVRDAASPTRSFPGQKFLP